MEPRMKSRAIRVFASGLLIGLAIVCGGASAQDQLSRTLWSGAAFFTNNYTAADNWVGFDTGNSFDEYAAFGSLPTPRTSPNFDANNISVGQVRFNPIPGSSAGFTFNGSGRLTVDFGIENLSPAAQVINNPVATRNVERARRFANYNDSTNYGRLTFNNTVTLNGSLLVTAGDAGIVFNGGIGGARDLAVAGPGIVSFRASNSFSGDLIVLDGGQAFVSGGGRLANASDVIVEAGGELRLTGITDAINGLYGEGEVNLESNAQLVVGNFAGNGAVGDGDFSGEVTGNGRLVKRGTEGTLTLRGISTHIGGTVVEEGTLVVNSPAQGGGTGNTTVENGARLEGAGALAGNLVIQSGGTFSPGMLSGDTRDFGLQQLTLDPGARLEIDLGKQSSGTQRQDTLQISINASLAGDLVVSTSRPEFFTLGDRFTLIDTAGFGTITGQFDDVSFPDLPADVALDIEYLGNRVEAVVTASAVLAGDFNGDGNVDCADLDGYIGNIGATAAGALAALDFDGDGVLSSADADSVITTLVVTMPNGLTGTFPGDLNCDGAVDVLGDAFLLIANLNTAVTSYAQGDINFDGTVDVLGDAFALVGNLGNTNDP